MPRVSVLMVSHNSGAFLRPAVKSILRQTLDDLELVLVDNASTDGSVHALGVADPRLLIIRLEENRGPYGGARAGLPHCRADLVARMDADDLAHPARLERQVSFLRARPALSGVGAWAWRIDEQGKTVGEKRFPCDKEQVRHLARWELPLVHPSLVARRELFEEVGYRDLPTSGDYDFITRAVEQGREVANLPEHLLAWRAHDRSITRGRAALQAAGRGAARWAAARRRAGLEEDLEGLIATLPGLAAGRTPAAVSLLWAQRFAMEGNPELAALTAREAANLAAVDAEREPMQRAARVMHDSGADARAAAWLALGLAPSLVPRGLVAARRLGIAVAARARCRAGDEWTAGYRGAA